MLILGTPEIDARVNAMNGVRMLLAGDGLPFIKASSQDDAARSPEGVAEGRLFGNGPGARGVELAADGGIFGPSRFLAKLEQLHRFELEFLRVPGALAARIDLRHWQPLA